MSDEKKGDAPAKKKTSALGYVALGAIAVVAWQGLSGKPKEAASGAGSKPAQVVETSQPGATVEPAEPPMPKEQQAFHDAIVAARAAYDSAENDLAKGGTRPARGAAICGAVEGRKVDGWVGTVYALSTNSEGKGVLSIEMPGDIWLSTWNNALSDISSDTLIDPASSLFSDLAKLSEGQKVTFSGSLFSDKEKIDCFDEKSLSLPGSMEQPEFVFDFSDVVAAQ